MIEIRPFQTADEEAVIQLWRQCLLTRGGITTNTWATAYFSKE
jgi:hypothetical protein